MCVGAGSAAARKEALEQLGSVLEAAPTLPLLDDRSITMAEIAQVRPLLVCHSPWHEG
jgi:hypothetical protein